MPARRSAWRIAPSALLACGALTLLGCTTTYQPMTGLHRPVAIDPTLANFADTRIALLCRKGDGLEESDVRGLCRKLTRLFENQGAVVEARTAYDPPQDDRLPDGDPDAPVAARAVRLRVDLTPRLINAESIAPFWWDNTADFTFAQDISVRDETGFLLARTRLIGRFVRRLGWGGDAEARFSRDFYGQVSQLAFNARMRWTVAGAPPPPKATTPDAPGSQAPAAPASAPPPAQPAGAPTNAAPSGQGPG